ncbi:MAG TPA: type II toxin-antitoxin system VapC family toxin [Nitrososphaerales archaeon]|nr:type II toxin-antitoxin system VapC family toxin [Nitrososphaerales archaeon]
MILDASSLYLLLKRGDLRSLRNAETLDLAFYEIGNSMLKGLRRKLITPESFARALNVLGLIGETMVVRKFGELDARRVTDLAQSIGFTFYDASYLTLADMSKETLATNDRELSEAARRVGVRTVAI